jgi:hypothetical protein
MEEHSILGSCRTCEHSSWAVREAPPVDNFWDGAALRLMLSKSQTPHERAWRNKERNLKTEQPQGVCVCV